MMNGEDSVMKIGVKRKKIRVDLLCEVNDDTSFHYQR